MLVTLGIIVVLLFISALMSGSETALFSLSPSDVDSIRKNGSRPDNAAILKLFKRPDYLLATVLIGNNMVNICIVILSNNFIDSVVVFASPTWEFVIKTIIVTFVLLLFGEIIPKIFATDSPLRFARKIATPIAWISYLFTPLSWVLISTSKLVGYMLAKKKSAIQINELQDAIEITDGHNEQERQMLSGIVGFVNRDVEQVMKPRIDIVAIDAKSPFPQVRQTIIKSGFSRIPVYEESLDEIVGILYVRDMLPFISEEDGFEWRKYLHEPYFVPEYKKINDLLSEFQSNKVHIAIVVDEYGSTLGLISMEDILEEIVGEISDESDLAQANLYTRIDDETYIFEGKTHITDFEKVLGLDDDTFADVKGDAETVAGLMLELKHDFLRKGESVMTHSMKLTVENIEGYRIDKVRVKLNQ